MLWAPRDGAPVLHESLTFKDGTVGTVAELIGECVWGCVWASGARAARKERERRALDGRARAPCTLRLLFNPAPHASARLLSLPLNSTYPQPNWAAR